MQKILTLIAFLTATTLHAQMKWEWISPLPQGNDLHDIHFSDSLHGIAIGGMLFFGGGGSLLRTTDAGESWQTVDIDSYENLLRISFADADRGIVVGTWIVLHTDDGGETWEKLPSPAGTYMTDVAYSKSGTVLGVDRNRTLLHRSTDHGATWDTISLESRVTLLRVAFVDDTVAVVGASRADSTSSIYQSMDGGASWAHVAILTEPDIRDFSFNGTDAGVLVAGSRVYATSDRGAGWSAISPILTGRALESVTLAGASGVIAIPADSRIGFVSTDRGATWDSLAFDHPLEHFSPDAVAMADSLRGVIVGSFGGGMLLTIDGGRSWSPIPQEQLPVLHNVLFDTPGQGVIIGEKGTILRTEDGGRTWSPVSSGTDQNLNTIDFGGNGSGMIVGDSGVILRTDDGGRSWSRLGVPDSTKSFSSVDMLDADQAMVVSAHTIIATSDGGRTWDRIFNDTLLLDEYYHTLGTIAMTGPRRAVAFGSEIRIYTSDRGATWQRQSGSYEQLGNLEFSDSLIGYVTGGLSRWPAGNALAYRTTDGGATWRGGDIEMVYLDDFPNPWMGAIEPLGGGKALAVGMEGFYRTLDTGRTWKFEGRLPTRFDAMARTGEGGIVGIGYYGIIMRAELPVDSGVSHVVRHESSIASGLSLEQNMPNPFSSSTTIRFSLPSAGETTLTIYDPLGRVVAVPVDGQLEAGVHSISWSGNTGAYLYVLRHGAGSVARVMICR